MWPSSDYVGAKVCKACHAAEYSQQVKTHHAKALRPIRETRVPQILVDRPLRERNGYAFEYRLGGKGLEVTTSRGEDRASAILEWAFGSGAQAITPVGRTEGAWVEHRISYYSEPSQPAITLGHPTKPSDTALAALGLFHEANSISRCFHCHATGVETEATGLDLSDVRPGIECERCHGPGRYHVEAGRAARPREELMGKILNPGRLSSEKIVLFCGQCHRKPNPLQQSQTPELDNPMTVRFQPLGFLASRCFQESKAFSCLTCHSPHEDVQHGDDAFYVAKCLVCHGENVKVRKQCRRTAKENCLPCHMAPTSPAPYLIFTDHRIRLP